MNEDLPITPQIARKRMRRNLKEEKEPRTQNTRSMQAKVIATEQVSDCKQVTETPTENDRPGTMPASDQVQQSLYSSQ